MGKIIVTEFVTLDGVMEAPGGEPGHPHTGWVIPHMGPEQLSYKFNEILEAESHLLGRVTYESFAGAWPYRTGEFAEKINAMPKHVVSADLAKERPLDLIETRTFPSGVVVQRYAPSADETGRDLSIASLCSNPVRP